MYFLPYWKSWQPHVYIDVIFLCYWKFAYIRTFSQLLHVPPWVSIKKLTSTYVARLLPNWIITLQVANWASASFQQTQSIGKQPARHNWKSFKRLKSWTLLKIMWIQWQGLKNSASSEEVKASLFLYLPSCRLERQVHRTRHSPRKLSPPPLVPSCSGFHSSGDRPKRKRWNWLVTIHTHMVNGKYSIFLFSVSPYAQ